MVPAIESTPSWTALTEQAMYRRLVLLAYYEYEYERLVHLLGRVWNNPNSRLLALRERYPQALYPKVSDKELRAWKRAECSSIVHKLVGDRVGLTATTVRKYLQQARKDRQRH